uniref:Uncharacterized protein n=1 Tax=Parascaris univalens TaxID=6257 RepID=A0A914ZW12_PARUN
MQVFIWLIERLPEALVHDKVNDVNELWFRHRKQFPFIRRAQKCSHLYFLYFRMLFVAALNAFLVNCLASVICCVTTEHC